MQVLIRLAFVRQEMLHLDELGRISFSLPKSKELSWLLRHGAPSLGISMDPAGWVQVADVLAYLKVSYDELAVLVQENSKNRLQLDHQRIRACQGHSNDNPAIVIEALEASWSTSTTVDSVWHGTHVEALKTIAKQGIKPMGRTHVHCAASMDSPVGKRANVDIVLEISSKRIRQAGFTLYQAFNGVVLVRFVPSSCILHLHPQTRKGRAKVKALESLFNISTAL